VQKKRIDIKGTIKAHLAQKHNNHALKKCTIKAHLTKMCNKCTFGKGALKVHLAQKYNNRALKKGTIKAHLTKMYNKCTFGKGALKALYRKLHFHCAFFYCAIIALLSAIAQLLHKRGVGVESAAVNPLREGSS
jgi:hypothetical protein